MMVPMFDRLKARAEWKFFGVLPKADRPLAIAWWAVLGLRGLLPALFAIAMGVLVGSVQRGSSLAMPLARGRHGVRAAAGLAAVPSCDRREPRQPHRRMALRPVHHRLRHAARHGASRETRA